MNHLCCRREASPLSEIKLCCWWIVLNMRDPRMEFPYPKVEFSYTYMDYFLNFISPSYKVLGFELLGILIWLKGCSWIARYLVSISTCSIASLNFYDLIAVGHTSPIRRSILVINFGLQESTLDFRVYKRSKQVSGRNGPLFTIKLWALFANKPLTTSPPYATIPHRSLLLFAGVGHDEEEEAGILSPRRKEHDSLDFDFCLISRFSRTHKWKHTNRKGWQIWVELRSL